MHAFVRETPVVAGAVHWGLTGFWILAALEWGAAAWHAPRLEYVVKPAALAALAIWAYSSGAPALLVLGLACSLAGDVFLMLPGDLFLFGLGAFLAAHLAYLAVLTAPFAHRAFWAAGLLVATAPLHRRILGAVRRPPLLAACVVYMLALVAMTGSTLAAGPIATGVGGLLFLLSDTLLAWNRFVRPWSWAHTAVMITYHLGQFGLAWGITRG